MIEFTQRSLIKKRSSLRNSRGFTLFEIMIVVGIIGTLFALLLPNVMKSFNNSRFKQTKIAISQIVQALNNYQIDCGKYPSTLDFVVKPDPECANWGPEPYMKSVPKDAWGQAFTYEVSGSSFVVRSPGYKGKEITSEEVQ